MAVIARAHNAIRTLIATGFPLDHKNARGWYALDEAISLGDRTAVELLFVAQKEAFKALLKEKKVQLMETMRTMPDCTLQVKWELGSALFGPIVRRVAPHDTYTIYKYKSLLRVDGSLMGIKDAQGLEEDDAQVLLLGCGGGIGGGSGGGCGGGCALNYVEGLQRGAPATPTSTPHPSQSGLLPEWKRGQFSLLVDAATNPSRMQFVDWTKRTVVDLAAERKAHKPFLEEEVVHWVDVGVWV